MYFQNHCSFQLSPSAQMYMRVGRITIQDVVESYKRRGEKINLPRCDSVRVYATAEQMEKDEPIEEFDIYPVCNDPSLFAPTPPPVESVPAAFADFVEGMDLSL